MEKRNKFTYYLFSFLLSPVLALLYGIANFKDQNAKRTLLLFFCAFGFTMILTPGKDSYDLVLLLKHYFPDLTFSEFLNEIFKMVTLERTATAYDEPFYYIISYVISKVTLSENWLYMIIGLIFGFFYIKGVSLIHNETTDKWNLSLAALFVFFFSWVSLNGINAPRNWTACWVFFCGAVLYLKTKQTKHLLLVMLAPFIHFAYLVISLPFYVQAFFKDLKYTYLVLLIVSYGLTASTDFIKPYLATTGLGEAKVESYLESERWKPGGDRADLPDNRNFHAKYYRLAADISIQFLFISSIIFFGYFSGKNHDSFLTGLASISMMILSLSNIFASIPVLSNRLFVNFGNFALAYLVLLFSKNYDALKSKHWMINLCIPAILLFLFTQYSQFGDFMDFRVLFSPLTYPFLGDDPVSMKAFLRQLLGG